MIGKGTKKLMFRNLFIKKTLSELETEAENQNSLKRHLTAMNLVLLGIGCVIGAGIFVRHRIGSSAVRRTCGIHFVCYFGGWLYVCRPLLRRVCLYDTDFG